MAIAGIGAGDIPRDPTLAFRYNVHIPGIVETGDKYIPHEGFSEISGLSAELETELVFSGGDNNSAFYLPKQVKNTPLVLKKGLFNVDSTLIQWVKNTLFQEYPKEIEPKNVVIRLLNDQREPIIMWTIINAFAVKWEVSGFNSMENKLVIETITLNYSSFKFEFV